MVRRSASEDQRIRVRRTNVSNNYFRSEYIFAYPEITRTKDGPVLFLDCNTDRMSAAELNEKFGEVKTV